MTLVREGEGRHDNSANPAIRSNSRLDTHRPPDANHGEDPCGNELVEHRARNAEQLSRLDDTKEEWNINGGSGLPCGGGRPAQHGWVIDREQSVTARRAAEGGGHRTYLR